MNGKVLWTELVTRVGSRAVWRETREWWATLENNKADVRAMDFDATLFSVDDYMRTGDAWRRGQHARPHADAAVRRGDFRRAT